MIVTAQGCTRLWEVKVKRGRSHSTERRGGNGRVEYRRSEKSRIITGREREGGLLTNTSKTPPIIAIERERGMKEELNEGLRFNSDYLWERHLV